MNTSPLAAAAAPTWLGKGATLLRLAPLLRHSRVPPGQLLSRHAWQQEREACLQRLRTEFAGGAVAVRSSRADEDAPQQSQAGHYRSLLDVPAGDAAALAVAIETVFASYGSCRADDALFVQRMAAARLCAVAATHAVEDGADYYAFSLAAGTRTDVVTRGDAAVDTVYIAHEAPPPRQADLALLHRALLELREHCGPQPLEAEMVIAGDEVLLLQARPLLLRRAPAAAAPRRRALAHMAATLAQPSQACAGALRVLALMPDWNTAELLGSQPRPLALSLFRHAIGERAWHGARRLLGYRRLCGVPLLQPLAGRPYIDVRASANSLLPPLPREQAAALADAWQQRLLDQPQLHDKYEFEIAQTCVDFDFGRQWQQRYAGVLTPAALAVYRERLQRITARCIAPLTLQQALAALNGLAQRPPLDRDANLRACTRAGLVFALIARLAFVFEALLRSAVTRGALGAERLLQLQRSSHGVTRAFLRQGTAARGGYGFLRAGTFEITTPRLAQLELVSNLPLRGAEAPAPFEATPAEHAALAALLRESGYSLAPQQLLAGYARAREAREKSKYFLSQQVSLVLEELAQAGAAQGLDRETLSWLELPIAENLSRNPIASAAHARAAHAADALLRLPLVLDPRQPLQQVHIAAGTPTFIGRERATAPLCRVDAGSMPAAVPAGAILAIAGADPGYDWIFTRAPAGLITAYGGPNSHMAIRCAELGIPAVLGLGLERWQRLARASHLSLDAQAQLITAWSDDTA